jgi:cytochrome c-type biogenesis protein CcmH|tara:strand:+ start:566 stop:1042 length:477 start_codon:yes stop_codon:yes gene_type:complete
MGKNPLFMLILSIIISLPLNVVAVEPSEILQNPQLETRARSLSQNIRCLVCQNQSIDDSNASLAKDLRKIVREQLVSGASDDEIYNFLIERYGDFVLLRPPVKATTYILWYGPLFIFFAGLVLSALFLIRRKRILPEEPLSHSEKEELSRLISRKDER